MSGLDILWQVNLPELFDAPDAACDDADIDEACSLFASDGTNGRVYRLSPSGEFDSYPVIRMRHAGDRQPSLNLAVASDSTFCVADADEEFISRYGVRGEHLGDFPAPGVVSLCRGPEGMTYVLACEEGSVRLDVYDQFGLPVDSLAAPPRYRAHLDPSLVNLDADNAGNVYITYGMPPYRICKVHADGSDTGVWEQPMDYPEDAVLIADIAVDPTSEVVWVLLACKREGRQLLDAFSLDGEFLGTVAMPHSRTLYGIACSAGPSELYLVDTGTGPGSGDIVRVRASL